MSLFGSHTLNCLQAYQQQSCYDAAYQRYYARGSVLDSKYSAREAILVAKYYQDMDLCTNIMLAEILGASAWAAAESATNQWGHSTLDSTKSFEEETGIYRAETNRTPNAGKNAVSPRTPTIAASSFLAERRQGAKSFGLNPDF
jgi:hypothetical protein